MENNPTPTTPPPVEPPSGAVPVAPPFVTPQSTPTNPFGASPANTDPFTATPPSPAPVFSPTSKPKSHKTLIILVGSIFLVAIATFVVFAFFLPKSNSNDTATKNQATTNTSKPASVKPETASTLVSELTPSLTGQLVTNDPSRPVAAYVASWKPSDAPYGVIPAAADVQGVVMGGTADQVATNATAIDQFLTTKHFTKATNTTVEPQITTYSSDATLCNVMPNPQSTTPFIAVACADKTAYEAAVTLDKPFVAAYQSSQDFSSATPLSQYIFSSAAITDSKTAGYKTATVSVSVVNGTGFTAVFDQTPDSVWHYFTGTQAELSCTAYSTQDLQKAFVGTTCLNTKKKNTVVAISAN